MSTTRDILLSLLLLTATSLTCKSQSATGEDPPDPAAGKLSLASSSMAAREPEAEDWDEEEDESAARSFLFKELVLSGFYSFDGVPGLPPGDRTEDHLEISPRPPANYVGVDYIRTFTSTSAINNVLPEWLPLEAVDFHPRLVYDRMESSDGFNRLKFAPQDLWARFNPGGIDRLTLRLGQFVIPYGVNPVLAPRQRFILPIEATDLGLKWDWGVNLKGPAGRYDWEIAATIGSGESLHSPYLFRDSDRTSYLITGRIGAPTYWDFQHGLSFLYGDLPVIMGPSVLSDAAISRWRLAYDAFYKYGTFLLAGAQLTYGQDGFAGDEEFVGITGGEAADVLGWRLWLDWVVPQNEDLRLAAQIESLRRDIDTPRSDNTAAIFQATYSFTTHISAALSYREELNNAMGMENDALYLTLVYYGL
ncbi:MAG: hypothetical protein QGF67_14535 [Lentisphaeria bacterium]|nr:hypothetical protein [Lentisphaeria bacterium]MDP7742656.1 hypothetical protein [Lentisphaeria bacterium]